MPARRIGTTRTLIAIALLHAWATAASAAPAGRPDLVIDQSRTAGSWTIGSRYFAANDCVLLEGCVTAPGLRTLLAFTTQPANISRTDLVLGDPNNNPDFVFSVCHQHYHYDNYAAYELTDAQGGTVVTGHKQGFCVEDIERYLPDSWVPPFPLYNCDYQGIQGGWSDVYEYSIDCQWIDVTGVAPGDYDLRITANPARKIHESDYSNNTATIPVSLPDRSGVPDLVLDASSIAATRREVDAFFAPTDPAVTEGCVGAAGYRRLLLFDVKLADAGPFDLFLGTPGLTPAFQFVPAHGHYHLPDLLEYRLLDAQGTAVASTRQEVWFPADSTPWLTSPWVRPVPFYQNLPSFMIQNIGVQRGWAARTPAQQTCQWIDVTDVPFGTYTLSVTVNPSHSIPEQDDTNDTVSLSTSIASPPGIPHRPDGDRVPGNPLTVWPDPGGVRVTYDVTSCPASNYNIYYSQRPPRQYRYDAALCDIGASGEAVVPVPDPAPGGLTWFLIVGHDGTTEGGHGYDSAGRERPLSGAGLCGIAQSTPSPTCLVPQ